MEGKKGEETRSVKKPPFLQLIFLQKIHRILQAKEGWDLVIRELVVGRKVLWRMNVKLHFTDSGSRRGSFFWD